MSGRALAPPCTVQGPAPDGAEFAGIGPRPSGLETERVGGARMWSFAWKNLITRPTRTALAVLGLTIPVLAFLGLFSLTGGIRHLMGDTLASMDNLMVLSANALAPVLS